MSNPGDPLAQPAPAEGELDDDAVLAFLERNPDFLARHPDALAGMLAPGRWSGDGVVDMQQYLLNRRSQEMAELRDAAEHVIETSRSNMSVQMRTHAAVISLLGASTWDDLLHVVTHDWPLLLDVDAVSLGFEAAGPAQPRFMENDIHRLEAGYLETIFEGGLEVRLYRQIADDGTLFGGAAGIVRSAALARIHPGHDWPAGVLALGARDVAFHQGQGTELISFLCRVLESCLARVIAAEDAGAGGRG
jgi:uncharacterized protein YigA (DUF484 family)